MGNLQSLDHSGQAALSKSEIERMERRLKRLVVFQMYDADDDGLVTREDLVRQLLETNSRGMATDNVESIAQATLEAFDYDGDGALNYGEFVQLITSQRHVAA
ncbi:hypothetical protein QBZ16_000981 [Prototheca wickerhamii]|uniref:EF-hand domain-containing protein n=1 Tax=Prototheca wickerhamii TaxID=3111 RepID=A0AAD9MM65_PROWI|nr:hypothetical protein QBZ16_000981 [Prototheca wickerhamii]